MEQTEINFTITAEISSILVLYQKQYSATCLIAYANSGKFKATFMQLPRLCK